MSRIIAGSLFDFMGFLTTREAATSFGSRELASPAVDLLKEWADTRGLHLDDADVTGWKEALSQEAEAVASVPEDIAGLAHEVWAAAQLLPGEGIADGVARIIALLAQRDAGHAKVPVEALKEVIRISDRKHEAWDAVKAAMLTASKESNNG